MQCAVFDTFPWPQFSSTGRSRGDETQTSSSKEKSETPHIVSSSGIQKIDAVAAAARPVRLVRAEALQHLKSGVRALYRTLELPGKNPLKDAHAALDAAVLAAYGFSSKKDLLAQLLALNLEDAGKIERGEPLSPQGRPGALSHKMTVKSNCPRICDGMSQRNRK